MVDIYIKDQFGKLILSDNIKEEVDLHYERKIVMAKKQLLTVTITLSKPSPSQPQQWNEKDIHLFHKIIELISKDLSRNFSIEELAEHVGMNRTKLQAGFKQLFNKTINSFAQELKMKSAKNLINSSKGYSLKEIAGMLGYRHPNHFSVAFKKRFGISPSAFKNFD